MPPLDSDANPPLGPPVVSFDISGRLSLKQGERQDHLKFDWRHTPDNDSVLLLSPLGQGLAEIARDRNGARLSRPNEPPVAAESLSSLALQIFGTPVPLEELGDWLRGMHGLQGNVAGWTIRIVETMPHGDTRPARRLPRRLDATHGDIELTLIVDSWEEAL